MAKKKTQGRKKIEMKMIANENARRITFSKRRNGLFKKATELSTLCRVEIAIIVFSVGGKVFTFGHPSVESIIDRFLNEDKQVDKHSISHAMKYQEAKCHELKQRFEEMHQEVEEKRKQRKALEKNILAQSSYKSFEEYIEGLGLCELQQLKEKMENLKEKVAQQGKLLQTSNSLKHVEEGNLENIEKHTLDGSPIPIGWLRL